MTLVDFTDGQALSDTQIENQFNELLTQIGLNHVRTLIDHTGVYSKAQIDGWGEAYTTITGRNGSVNTDTGNTTSAFITIGDTMTDAQTNYYVHGIVSSQGTGTLNDSGYTNPTYAFDGDLTTYSEATNDGNSYLGKTFSATTITYVRVKCEARAYYASGNPQYYVAKLQTYNGSTWSDVATLFDSPSGNNPGGTGSFDGWVAVNASVQGVRVYFTHDTVGGTDRYGRLYELDWGVATTTGSIIEHAIPSGTFSATISKAFLTALVDLWETGANIQYKLTNGSEDSGWLETEVVSSFTAFTSQPTKLIIRLVPKSGSPTTGYPAIRGWWCRAT